MFRSRSTGSNRKAEEENPFLLSFSDLMASLVAIFILALIVMMVQLHLKQQELTRETERMEEESEKKATETERIRITLIELVDTLEEIQETQNAIDTALDGVGLRERSLTALLEGVQEDLKEKGIEVIVAENGTVLRIPERALNFELGSYQIEEEYRPAANTIGTALLMALQQQQNLELLDTVFIEGHTDAVPNNQAMGNWGLSAYRAIALWNFWTKDPGACGELANLRTLEGPHDQGGRPLISVSGYAETRPTGSIRSPEVENEPRERGNSADRRIDIRFTLATEERKNLQGLKDHVSEMKEKTNLIIEKLKKENP